MVGEPIGNATAEKSGNNAEFLLKLADHAQQSIVARRSFEWKINLLLWSGVPVMSGFLAAHVVLPLGCVWILGVIFMAIGVIYSWPWQQCVQTAHETDKALKNVLLDKLASPQYLGIKPALDAKVSKYSVGTVRWMVTYIAITVCILLASWIVLFATAARADTQGTLTMSSYEVWMIVIGLVGTVIAASIAALAIWGDWFRNRLVPPRPRLTLRSPKGDLAPMGVKSRYYHLTVSNDRFRPQAKNMAVYLIQIDRRGATADWAPEYSTGPLPLRWQYSEHYSKHCGRRSWDIGSERYCDLGFITEEKPFVLSLEFTPDWCRADVTADRPMRVHLIAVGDNAESNRLVLELEWDGGWNEDDDEMANHLTVNVVEGGV